MDNVIKAIDGTLLASIQDDLREYLLLNRNTKFTIYSDYCLDDRKKPNKVASFSIVPYDHEFADYANFLSKLAPHDIKSCRVASEKFLNHISEDRLFHVSFMIGSLKGITENSVLTGRHHAIQTLDYTTSMIESWIDKQPECRNYYNSIIKKIEIVKRSLDKKNPNLNLFRNVVLISLLAAYLAYLLTKEAGAEIIGWFSDRDKIVEVWDAIAQDLFAMNHNALCARDGISAANTKLAFGVPDKEEDKLWYDSINRIPDHLAGALASWCLTNNTVNHTKHSDILQKCFADNKFCSIVKIEVSPEISRCSRIIVSKQPFQLQQIESQE